MSEGPRVVNTSCWSDTFETGAYEALKKSEEPCVMLKLYLNGSNPLVDGVSWHIGSEMDAALLVPESWFERLEARVAALELEGMRRGALEAIRLIDKGRALDMKADGGQPAPGSENPYLHVPCRIDLRPSYPLVYLCACKKCGERYTLLELPSANQRCDVCELDGNSLLLVHKVPLGAGITKEEFMEKLGKHHAEETLKAMEASFGGKPASKYHRHVEIYETETEGLDLAGFKTLLREVFQEIGDGLVTDFLKERQGADE